MLSRSSLFRLTVCLGGCLVASLPIKVCAQSQGSTNESVDEYLLGMVGTAHVMVLHDYFSILVEQSRSATARSLASTKLEGLGRHCTRLATELTFRSSPDSDYAQLAELFGQLSVECEAAQNYVSKPSAETYEEFQVARSKMGKRLKNLNAENPDSPD